MSTRTLRRPVVTNDGTLDDFRRLRQRVIRLQLELGKGSDVKQLLALFEDLTTVTRNLVAEAADIRRQITALQHGLMATTAYRRTQNLASGRATGERK